VIEGGRSEVVTGRRVECVRETGRGREAKVRRARREREREGSLRRKAGGAPTVYGIRLYGGCRIAGGDCGYMRRSHLSQVQKDRKINGYRSKCSSRRQTVEKINRRWTSKEERSAACPVF